MTAISDAQSAVVFHGLTKKESVVLLELPKPTACPDYITSFRIDWMRKYVNTPTFHITLANDLSKLGVNFLFEHNKGVWYGSSPEGFVELHYHNGRPEKQDGYGGRAFKLQMKDGTEKTLYGPWHGGASGAEAAGFPPVIEITHHVGSMGYFGIYVQLPLFAAILAKFDPERKLVKVIRDTYITIEPLTRAGLRKEQYKDFKSTTDAEL